MSYRQNLMQPAGQRTAMKTGPNHSSPALVKRSYTGKKHPPGPSSAGQQPNKQLSRISSTQSKHHPPIKSIGESSCKPEKPRPLKQQSLRNDEGTVPKKFPLKVELNTGTRHKAFKASLESCRSPWRPTSKSIAAIPSALYIKKSTTELSKLQSGGGKFNKDMKSICRAKMIGGPKPGAKPKTRGQESQRKIWGVDMNTKQVRRSGVDACKEECKVQNVKVSKGPATKKLHSRVDSTSGTQQKTCHASLKSYEKLWRQTPTGIVDTATTAKGKKSANGPSILEAEPKCSGSPAGGAVPSPETPLLEFLQYLSASATEENSSPNALRHQALQLSQQYNETVGKGRKMSALSMAMKLEVALKCLEAEVEEKEAMRQEVMLQTGESLLVVARIHGSKVVTDTFTQQCFKIMAQRLGVRVLMECCECVNRSDYRASTIIAQAIDIARSTAKELQDLQHDDELCPTSCEQAVLALLQSLLQEEGLAPMKETFLIARQAIGMLLARSLSMFRLQAPTLETPLPQFQLSQAGSHTGSSPAISTGSNVSAEVLEEEAIKVARACRDQMDFKRSIPKPSVVTTLMAGIRCLEAALEKNEANSANSLLNIRRAMFMVSEVLSGKVIANDFIQKSFRILAQILAVCCLMGYHLHANQFNKTTASWILEQAINMASAASEELKAIFHATQCPSPSEFAILASLQSLAKSRGRFAPVQDILSNARRAISKLMAHQ